MRFPLCALALVVTALGFGQQRAGAYWRPPPTTAPWQWQLQGPIDASIGAPVYDIDGFEATPRTVRELHRLGRKVVCYLDVGSWESYRPDKGEFPRSAIGRRYQGFPDERWLDVGHFQRFERPLKRRFAMCAGKGFDAVEPDNVAGWEPENHTGFQITRAEQLRFNRWVAGQVRARGMAVALKNDGRQAPQLIDAFDFAIVEQCFQYDECDLYRPFVREGKAVFEAEYELKPAEYCDRAKALGFSAIGKSYDLFARPWRTCASSETSSSRAVVLRGDKPGVFGIGPQDQHLGGSFLQQPDEVVTGEARAGLRRRRHDDAVEALAVQ